MTEEEKKTITQEKHPGRVAQGHRLAARMKKGKEEILRNKQQSTVQSTEQSTEQSSVQSSVQSTVYSTEQPSVQSNGAYTMALVYLLSLPLAFVYFLRTTRTPGKSSTNNPLNQKDVICFRKNIQ